MVFGVEGFIGFVMVMIVVICLLIVIKSGVLFLFLSCVVVLENLFIFSLSLII